MSYLINLKGRRSFISLGMHLGSRLRIYFSLEWLPSRL